MKLWYREISISMRHLSHSIRWWIKNLKVRISNLKLKLATTNFWKRDILLHPFGVTHPPFIPQLPKPTRSSHPLKRMHSINISYVAFLLEHNADSFTSTMHGERGSSFPLSFFFFVNLSFVQMGVNFGINWKNLRQLTNAKGGLQTGLLIPGPPGTPNPPVGSDC